MSTVSEDIKGQFVGKLQSDHELKKILNGIKESGGDYSDAEKYASRAGQLLTAVLQANISENNFPVGSVNEIAGMIIPAMELNYNAVTQVTGMVQKSLNKDGGIGMNSVNPEFNRSNALNLVGRMAKYDSFEEAAWMLEEPIQTAALGITDDILRKNADFQYKSGMKPKIIRTCESDACEWCQMLAGEYDYEEVKDRSNPVWQRHNNCSCEITYEPGEGKVQDVKSKQWFDHDNRNERISKSKDEDQLWLKERNRKSKERKQKAISFDDAERISDSYVKNIIKEIDYSKYDHTEDGIIKPSKIIDHKAPKTSTPYDVVDIKQKDGTINRVLYNEIGEQGLRIHPTDHNAPNSHPKGGHKHYVEIDENGRQIHSVPFPLDDEDRKENGDII